MGKRLTPKQHQAIYAWLVGRDGEECKDCGVTPDELGEKLTIDHVDEDSDNWTRSNLALRCRPCNTAKSNRLSPRRGVSCELVSGDRVCVCGRVHVNHSEAAAARRSAIDFASGSAEMQASGLYEAVFREWLIEHLEHTQSITRKDALNSGAELTGGSPTTMQRYLDKLTSTLGPLQIARSDAGIQVVMLKQKSESRPNISKDRTKANGRQKQP